MASKKRKIAIIIFIAAITIGAIFASAWFYASYQLSRLDSSKESITKTLEEKLNRAVAYETVKASLTLRDGLSLRFTNVVITEKDRSSEFLNIKNAFLRVKIIPLLRNRLVFREVVLNQPTVSLKRDSAGVLNIADLLTRKKDDTTPEFRKLIVEQGAVTFSDEAAGGQSLSTSLDNLYCRIDSPFWTKRSHFHIKTSVIEDKNIAELELDGSYRPAPSGKPVYESTVRTSVNLKGADIKHYSPYLEKYTPVRQMTGYLNADMKFSGKFSDFKSKGTITVKDARFYYPGVFRNTLQPGLIQINYALKRDTESLNLDIGNLAVDKFKAKGSFVIDDLDKKDPLLKASAATAVFSLKEMKSYIPWGIIHKGVGGFIEAHVTDGNYRLIEGKLAGRLSQIKNMNKKENADVLFIRADVNKGVFEAGGTSPAFHNISGILELKNRQFSLKKTTGLFGSSPFTIEGGISDFAEPHPSVYNAHMKIQPARDEVLWLLGKEKFRSLGFKGNSALTLSGNGPADNFRIDARWDLTQSAYVYPDFMEKPAARKNQLTAQIVLNKDAFNISSFNYDLPPLNATGAMMFRYAGEKPASINIQAKAFDVRDVAPLFPFLRSFNPAGKCSLAVSGRGDLNDAGSMQWNGNISLSNVFLTPSSGIKSLRGLTGNVQFKGNSMETSWLKAMVGESYIQGKIRIDDFRKPRVICQFDTNQLKTRDLGIQSTEGEVNLRDVKGQIAFEDKMFHVDNLSFGLGKSSFNLSGDVRASDGPKITLALKSPYISYDDFDHLISLKYPQKENNASSPMELNADLRVDAGKFNEVDFRKLKAGLKFSRGILEIERFDVGCFDGQFKAKGKVNIHYEGQNYYDLNVSVNKMSLEKLQRYLRIGDRTMTGSLSLTGDLYAIGRNVAELKKTAAGTFKIRAEKGVLKKFSVLSKAFSLLNVLQLAKLRLPDMTTQGMAYTTITSSVKVKDGVLSTDDFFIDSDSLQISASGKVDFIREKLDCIAGIHPLQSLDLIASKIPIAGWLITDERGKLITVNFKIDGNWDDPNVTPINARSIGKGTLDIFRKIFQLPEKLITDTGEVLLGH